MERCTDSANSGARLPMHFQRLRKLISHVSIGASLQAIAMRYARTAVVINLFFGLIVGIAIVILTEATKLIFNRLTNLKLPSKKALSRVLPCANWSFRV